MHLSFNSLMPKKGTFEPLYNLDFFKNKCYKELTLTFLTQFHKAPKLTIALYKFSLSKPVKANFLIFIFWVNTKHVLRFDVMPNVYLSNALFCQEYFSAAQVRIQNINFLLVFSGSFNIYAMRVNMSVAIAAMVNNSALADNDSSSAVPEPSCPLPDGVSNGTDSGEEEDGPFNWDEETQVGGSGYILGGGGP